MIIGEDWLIHTSIDVSGYKEMIDRIIMTHNLSTVDVSAKSTRGENSRQYNLIEYADEFATIQNRIMDQVFVNIFPNQKFNLASAWTVYGEENSYHLLHRHTRHDIATVLYLDVPVCSDTNQSGEFYYIYRDEHGEVQDDRILPEKGSLIIMPIHLYHGVYPQARGNRQTLNMDFELKI